MALSFAACRLLLSLTFFVMPLVETSTNPLCFSEVTILEMYPVVTLVSFASSPMVGELSRSSIMRSSGSESLKFIRMSKWYNSI